MKHWFCLVAVLSATACGSDSGGSDAASTGDSAVAGQCQGKCSFTGVVVDFKSKSPKEGVDVLVLNNDTGEALDLVRWPAFKSGQGGAVALDFPPEIPLVAFKLWGASGNMKFKESYQFNIKSTEQGKRLYAVWEGTYMAAMSSAAIKDVDPAHLGHFAGTIYFTNAQGEDEYVGCVVVALFDESGKKLEEEKDANGYGVKYAIRYFDTRTDMPTNLKTADGNEWTMTHTLNSRYMVGGVPPGKYRVAAHLRGQPDKVLGEVWLRPFPGSISIGNIYVSAGPDGKNPTPTDPDCYGIKDQL